MIIFHGLCSSDLFYIINLYFEQRGSRLLIFNEGFIRKISCVMIWWFLLCVANFSFPFLLHFFKELIILRVIINWNLYIIIYLIIIFFRSAYSLYLFSYVQQRGKGWEPLKFNMRFIKRPIS